MQIDASWLKYHPKPKEIERDKKSTLITLLEQVPKDIIEPEKPYIRLRKPDLDRDYETGAKILYVSPDELPQTFSSRVLGMYDSITHTIYIANNLPAKVENFVRWHEVGHAKGIRNEAIADAFAQSKTAYNLRQADELRKSA